MAGTSDTGIDRKQMDIKNDERLRCTDPITCISLNDQPTLKAVRQLLGDRTAVDIETHHAAGDDFDKISKVYEYESDEVCQAYESQMSRLTSLIHPTAYLRHCLADETFEKQGVISGQELLAVVLTIGAAGADDVQKLYAQGEYLQALISDAIQSAWLFAADLELREYLRTWCKKNGCGIRARMEPLEQLPVYAQQWICNHFWAQPGFDVHVTAGGMLVPEKSMCYLLVLDQDCTRFAAGHDCAHCGKTDCGMRQETGTENRIVNKASRSNQERGEHMQEKQIQIVVEDQGKKIICTAGVSLLSVLREKGIRVDAPCGGSGRCGKCRIRLVSGELEITPADRQYLSERELASGVRLACVARPTENLRIRILAKGDQCIATSASVVGNKEHEKEHAAVHMPQETWKEDPAGYQIAVDIGTTTLAACLYGCSAHENDGYRTVTAVNRGRDFGADVLSRMDASVHGKRARLQELLHEDVRELLERLCAQAAVQKQQIHRIVIAANMTMVHLLMGYSCETLGRAPFTPVNARLIRADALRILGDTGYSCPVEILPAVSAFVGGDIVAGMLALGMDHGQETALLLDVGTNGEMALRHEGVVYVTSAAAGPAFEGGGISCGCASIPGAICSVRLREADQPPVLHTIADAAPVGICGSGVLELVSELRTHGLIDETGLYVSDTHRQNGYAFAKSTDGADICFMQADVRAFQLAKGAIRAGIEALLVAAGVSAAAVTQVYLAGGFGVRMDEYAAVRTGLLPEQFAGRIYAVGNSSLSGAVYAGRHAPIDAQCNELLAQCRQIVLAEQPEFEENYLRYMNL